MSFWHWSLLESPLFECIAWEWVSSGLELRVHTTGHLYSLAKQQLETWYPIKGMSRPLTTSHILLTPPEPAHLTLPSLNWTPLQQLCPLWTYINYSIQLHLYILMNSSHYLMYIVLICPCASKNCVNKNFLNGRFAHKLIKLLTFLYSCLASLFLLLLFAIFSNYLDKWFCQYGTMTLS